jgi:hypothetical protein
VHAEPHEKHVIAEADEEEDKLIVHKSITAALNTLTF